MSKRVVALALTAALGAVGGAAVYVSITQTITEPHLQWLLGQYAATVAPPKSKPHAGILISAAPRPPIADPEDVQKHDKPISSDL